MSKRSKEHARIQLTRTLPGWVPTTAYDAEVLMHHPVGSTVEAQFWQNRSLKHLRLYWIILHACVANSENRYGSAEDLHSALKVALGYTQRIRLLVKNPKAAQVFKAIEAISSWMEPRDSQPTLKHAIYRLFALVREALEDGYETLVMPGSIALDRMDQAEFRVFFDRTMDQLRAAGYPVDDYIEEAKKYAVEGLHAA